MRRNHPLWWKLLTCTDMMVADVLVPTWCQHISSYRVSLIVTEVTHETSMVTSSNGNSFRVTGPLCGEITGHRWISLTTASDAELCVFFHLCLNKRLSKQSWGWWFETPSCSLWRHCNDTRNYRATLYRIAAINSVCLMTPYVAIDVGQHWLG